MKAFMDEMLARGAALPDFKTCLECYKTFENFELVMNHYEIFHPTSEIEDENGCCFFQIFGMDLTIQRCFPLGKTPEEASKSEEKSDGTSSSLSKNSQCSSCPSLWQKSYRCKSCSQTFSRFQQLKHHRKKHCRDQAKNQHRCTFCNL